MKIFRALFEIPVITLLIIIQISLQSRYLFASDIRHGETIFRNVYAGFQVRGGSDIRHGETIFRNVCAGFQVRGGSDILKGSRSLKLADLEKRGIANVNAIAKIANEGVWLYESLQA